MTVISRERATASSIGREFNFTRRQSLQLPRNPIARWRYSENSIKERPLPSRHPVACVYVTRDILSFPSETSHACADCAGPPEVEFYVSRRQVSTQRIAVKLLVFVCVNGASRFHKTRRPHHGLLYSIQERTYAKVLSSLFLSFFFCYWKFLPMYRLCRHTWGEIPRQTSTGERIRVEDNYRIEP